MDGTLEVKVGKITLKNEKITGGTTEGQKNIKMSQMAQDALVNLIVAILKGKRK